MLSVPVGQCKGDGFWPDLTPKQMLSLGVFGGKYMTDCAAAVGQRTSSQVHSVKGFTQEESDEVHLAVHLRDLIAALEAKANSSNY